MSDGASTYHHKQPGTNEIPQCAAGDYPVQDGHPLVYASLLNHANYFLEQKTRMPGYTEERGRPVRQQWFVTHEVNTIETFLFGFVKSVRQRSTTISKLVELSSAKCVYIILCCCCALLQDNVTMLTACNMHVCCTVARRSSGQLKVTILIACTLHVCCM